MTPTFSAFPLGLVACTFLLLVVEPSKALIGRHNSWKPLSQSQSIDHSVSHCTSYFQQQQQQQQQSRPLTTATTPTTTTTTSLRIGNFMGDKTKTDASLPRDVKDAIAKCKASVQQALSEKCSRMDIEMPVGAKFGVEKTSGKQKQRLSAPDSNGGDAPTRDMLDQSDRELARLFVEMFQPVGADNIAVVFADAGLADMAKKKWNSDYGANSNIMAIDRKKGAKKKGGGKNNKKGMGFAAKMAAEVEGEGGGPFDLPDNIEVALFVAPGDKELRQVERICEKVGMGTLVVLLNARLSTVEDFASKEAEQLFTKEFQPVFALAAASQNEAPGCLLYRSYPNPWVLARKPKVGPPKPILTQNDKPTGAESKQAYEALELGDVEKGIENVLKNVAGWFN